MGGGGDGEGGAGGGGDGGGGSGGGGDGGEGTGGGGEGGGGTGGGGVTGVFGATSCKELRSNAQKRKTCCIELVMQSARPLRVLKSVVFLCMYL